MGTTLKTLFKQPYWVISLVVGAFLVAFPYLGLGKDFTFTTHPAVSLLPVYVGIVLIMVSLAVFGFNTLLPQIQRRSGVSPEEAAIDETGGAFTITINACEVRVVVGRLESFLRGPEVAVVLPCNEYFDDECIGDQRSALGSYVNKELRGRHSEFAELVLHECQLRFGDGREKQKTRDKAGRTFDAGRCLLLREPLGIQATLALVSTTTQQDGEGLCARVSYLFSAISELSECLANARITEAVMPILGAGHGGLAPELAFNGLLLALSEAAHYGRGAQRLRRVTIVVYQKTPNDKRLISVDFIRRVLSLLGNQK